MPNNFDNLRCMAKRQSTPGTMAILLLGAIMFGPKLWDTARGEPWIDNRLTLIQSSQGSLIVEDVVSTNTAVYGERHITVESSEGTVLCSSRWSGAWSANHKRMWQLSALAPGCEVPASEFRICSAFSLFSGSGRRNIFSSFCSAPYAPSVVVENPK